MQYGMTDWRGCANQCPRCGAWMVYAREEEDVSSSLRCDSQIAIWEQWLCPKCSEGGRRAFEGLVWEARQKVVRWIVREYEEARRRVPSDPWNPERVALKQILDAIGTLDGLARNQQMGRRHD